VGVKNDLDHNYNNWNCSNYSYKLWFW